MGNVLILNDVKRNWGVTQNGAVPVVNVTLAHIYIGAIIIVFIRHPYYSLIRHPYYSLIYSPIYQSVYVLGEITVHINISVMTK